jgi:hypothetical protein
MKTVPVPVSTLETLIEGLQNAVNICYNVDSLSDDGEKSYPFAAGYSRSTMECVIQDLQRLKDSSN